MGGSSPGGGWQFFPSPPRPDRLWGLPSLLSNGYKGLFPSGLCVKLSTHLPLVPRSRMHGAIPPLPQYPFVASCSVKAQRQLYLLPSPLHFYIMTWATAEIYISRTSVGLYLQNLWDITLVILIHFLGYHRYLYYNRHLLQCYISSITDFVRVTYIAWWHTLLSLYLCALKHNSLEGQHIYVLLHGVVVLS
jgi:hypothetical protein